MRSPQQLPRYLWGAPPRNEPNLDGRRTNTRPDASKP